MSETNMVLFLDSAIKRACCFLEKFQWPGGFWIDFELAVGMSSQWVTAYISQSLVTAGGSQKAIDQAHNWLMQTQFNGGGWGFNRHVPPDADTVANVLLFFSGLDNNEKTVLSKVSEYLCSFQSTVDGGFKTYLPRPLRPGEERAEFLYQDSSWCMSHLSVTSLAVEALTRINLTHHIAIIQAAADYIKRQQTAEGYWNCYWWHGPMYGTYRAVRALSLLGETNYLKRAAAWLAETCCDDGGWGNNLDGMSAPFFTALAINTLLLGGESNMYRGHIQCGLSWLLDRQHDDGCWEPVPMLLTPVPQVRVPWEETDPSCSAAVQDQNRLFTTATVLSALATCRDEIGL